MRALTAGLVCALGMAGPSLEAKEWYQPEIGLCSKLPGRIYSYNDLEVAMTGTTSVEGLLDKLPEELTDNVILMKQTGSRQKANPHGPRTILYAKDASFLLAFDETSGFVETIQQNPQTKDFELRAISYLSGKPKPSEVNPDRCKTCHGDPPHPRFEPYPTWPGAYGEDEDRIGKDRQDLLSFLETKVVKSSTSRYARIPSLKRLYQSAKEVPTTSLQNDPFTILLAQRNFDRIYKDIEKANDFAGYKFALTAALVDCPSIETFLPTQGKPAKSPETFLQELEALEQKGLYVSTEQIPRTKSIQSKFFHVIERMGLSHGNWSMSGANPYAFSTGHAGIQDLLCQIAPALGPVDTSEKTRKRVDAVRNDPEWKTFGSAAHLFLAKKDDKLCADLKEKSLRYFRATPHMGTLENDGHAE